MRFLLLYGCGCVAVLLKWRIGGKFVSIQRISPCGAFRRNMGVVRGSSGHKTYTSFMLLFLMICSCIIKQMPIRP